LTYTLTLREGVEFSDGTPFDSAAAKPGFQRRIDMAAGPPYMLADVRDMQTPDPQTFVVALTKPVTPFLDYLASRYGPLMTSPAAIALHAVGDDRGAGRLASDTAGTGPYELTAAIPANRYTLTANEHYWGEAPQITTVELPVVAAIAVQRMQLENGQLELILHGPSRGDYEALGRRSHHRGPAGGGAGEGAGHGQPRHQRRRPRQARRDRPLGRRRGDRLPHRGQQPAGPGEPDAGHPPAGRPHRDGPGLPLAQFFALGENPGQRPDLLLASFNPDAARPDTWSRIYQYTDAPVNLQGCSVPEGDALPDAGGAEPDPA
jgi:peptide/nickel transport system substrate-binding protein